ncbi:PIG-L family deacetylase [SAR202 cluster bacterium AD-804-J14_MRT_500m]|nr:PIG-L family deacetylase [SAR202 cluster bacterium AD-804-J14_MRT_500m]
MTDITDRSSYKRAMVVIAHADDAEYGFSGTVASWCHKGMQVAYVICTDSSKGSSDPSVSTKEVASIRRHEQESAAKVLGVKELQFLDYEDSILVASLELRRDITREIRRFKPDVIICQSPVRSLGNTYVGHPDHLAAGEATLAAVFPTARDHLSFPELLKDGFKPHNVREVLVADTEHADTWIDVGDSLQTAAAALAEHKSQVNGRDTLEILSQWRTRIGEPQGIPYAEAFRSFLFRI